jgi:hypothetical protein
MWNLFNCYLSGRHDYGMWCEPGAIFLRCIHCGKRSPGWALAAKTVVAVHRAAVTVAPAAVTATVAHKSRVIPFGRAAAG